MDIEGDSIWSDVEIGAGRSAAHLLALPGNPAEENVLSVKTVDRVRGAWVMAVTSNLVSRQLQAEQTSMLPRQSAGVCSGRRGAMQASHHCPGAISYVRRAQGHLWHRQRHESR
jgi:hypothetical protein